MIIRSGKARLHIATAEQAERHGMYSSARLSEDGGLKQFGAYLETLEPGSRSSERHWHEQEDEFLYVLSGEATVIEDDGEHLLLAGDAACWPAGTANAHHVVNRSRAPCSYLIVGTRASHDVCHYPDCGRTQYTQGETWRLEEADGRIVKSGRVTRGTE
jgi:uncharacterized cupin superfamily protein